MKRILPVLAVLAMAVLVIAATRPPIPAPRVSTLNRAVGIAVPQLTTLLLSVAYPPEELSADLVFRYYYTTNIANPNWQILTNVTGGKTNVLIQVLPESRYYRYSTYSVFWGYESSFSGVTSTPPAPRGDPPLSISKP